MGRQETIGFILIGLVLIVWMWMNTPPPQEPQPLDMDTTFVESPTRPEEDPVVRDLPVDPQPAPETAYGRWFSHLAAGEEQIVSISTGLYTTELSTHGGILRRYELTEYVTWDKEPVQLIDVAARGDLSLLFTSTDGRLIRTRDLFFDVTTELPDEVVLADDESFTLTLSLPIAEEKELRKIYVFHNNRYSFDVRYELIGMHDIIANFEYQIVWDNGLLLTEYDRSNEAEFAAAYAYMGGELEKLDARNYDQQYNATFSGRTDWVGMRNKYFALALIPISDVMPAEGAYLGGERIRLPDQNPKENYSVALRVPFRARNFEASEITVFLGPMEYRLLRSYDVGIDKMLSLGIWLIRPISEYVILPLFKLLNSFISNFGLVIIVFSILIKVALHPLTKKQMHSMKKMQKLQPMMTELREKYKDDPQKMNREVMRLYSDYGVNPASGCLPMLPQLPILFALFTVFRSTIELRQEPFALWITDLSVPDRIIDLPFNIPILGADYLSGLALLMGLTLFIQQKMTMKDPRQQALVYIMPIVLTFLFTIFPSGLNLYYFMFNLLSVVQQYFVNKKAGDEPLRKVDPKKKKKGGFFGALEKQMQLSQAKKKMK
jgi:YidC/Oxa1 family membrane protein insertase